MIEAIRRTIRRVLAAAMQRSEYDENFAPVAIQAEVAHESSETQQLPYDESLLERARTQWQLGDWVSLSRLDRATLRHHPDRAKLALMAAAGHQQQGNLSGTRDYTRLALQWGCEKRLVGQILIAGVHNTLGRAASIAGQGVRAMEHFETAVALGTPGNSVRRFARARAGNQFSQLSLLAHSNRQDLPRASDRDASFSPSLHPPEIRGHTERVEEQPQVPNDKWATLIDKEDYNVSSSST